MVETLGAMTVVVVMIGRGKRARGLQGEVLKGLFIPVFLRALGYHQQSHCNALRIGGSSHLIKPAYL